MKLRLLLLLLIATVAAGCGSSSKKAASPATTAAASPTTQSSTPVVSGNVTGDCKKMVELSQKFSQAMSSTNSANSDPAAAAQQTAKVFHDFADAAPESVRGDLQTFAKGFDQYASALQGMHMTAGKVPSAADMAKLSKAAQALSKPDVARAEQHMSAWAQTNCGAAFGKTTP